MRSEERPPEGWDERPHRAPQPNAGGPEARRRSPRREQEARVPGSAPVASPSAPIGDDGDERDELRTRLLELTPFTWVTLAIVLANALVFGAMVASGAPAMAPPPGREADAYLEMMLAWGAAHGSLTAAGEPWRLFTPMFLHWGVLHLAVNMWVLWDAGKVVERLYGNRTFLAMYLLAGLGGSLASLAWAPGVVSVGASGAVFGVLGALIAFQRHGDAPLRSEWLARIKRSGLMFVLANVLYGFGAPGVDHAAHIGGFVTGFVLGKLLVRPLRPGQVVEDTQGERTWAAVLAMAAITTLVLYDVGRRLPEPPVLPTAPGQFRVEPLYEEAMELFEAGEDWPAVEDAFTTVLEHDPGRATAYLYRAQARYNQGKLRAAAEDAREFTRLDPLSEMGPQIEALIRDARLRRGDEIQRR